MSEYLYWSLQSSFTFSSVANHGFMACSFNEQNIHGEFGLETKQMGDIDWPLVIFLYVGQYNMYATFSILKQTMIKRRTKCSWEIQATVL